MTDIRGTWQLNANGSEGTLTIDAVNAQGTVLGSMTFPDAPRIDAVNGTWDDRTGTITFERAIPDNPPQDYVGFLGDNHPDQEIILAGSFTQAGASRPKIGWFAIERR